MLNVAIWSFDSNTLIYCAKRAWRELIRHVMMNLILQWISAYGESNSVKAR